MFQGQAYIGTINFLCGDHNELCEVGGIVGANESVTRYLPGSCTIPARPIDLNAGARNEFLSRHTYAQKTTFQDYILDPTLRDKVHL